jgi:hypothetical protein
MLAHNIQGRCSLLPRMPLVRQSHVPMLKIQGLYEDSYCVGHLNATTIMASALSMISLIPTLPQYAEYLVDGSKVM